MYCVKCKKKTGNGVVTTQTTKNGRTMATSPCSVCSTKKCQFVKSGKKLKGSGAVGDFFSSIF